VAAASVATAKAVSAVIAKVDFVAATAMAAASVVIVARAGRATTTQP